MTEISEDIIRVTVAADFTDEVIERLQDISPKLRVERHFPDVPDAVYAETEVLYTIYNFPKPEQAPRLRWIQLHYAGLNQVMNHAIIQAEDVEVTTASGIHSVQMSEFCMAMILNHMYQIPRMLELKQQAHWPEQPFEVFKPHGLRDLTLGIAGYGSVGRELARLAHAMGMIVLATKRNLMQTAEEDEYIIPGTGDPTAEIPERLYPPEALASMVKDCDFVVLTVPLTDTTYHMVNEAIFKAMKETAVLINVARGPVVDEEALISALAAEEIAGAVLDVFEEEPLPPSSPLWNLDNVIISPHVSGYTRRYFTLAADLFSENLRRYTDNRPLLNRLKREYGY